jgi:tRNA threonylcarbamoyladenosine biosynthesis protein TsaE
MEYSFDQLAEIAKYIIDHATKNKTTSQATLITFSGDLGAGKTTLIQEIAKQLGVGDTLQSPTFVIYKRYVIPQSPWKYLIHGDMYRLEHANEIEKLGWNELLNDPENLLCIEWPEKIQTVVPKCAIATTITILDQNRRKIDIK